MSTVPALLPVLRPLSAPGGHRRLPAGRRLVSSPIAGFLHELLVVEDGPLRRFVHEDQLVSWGLDGAAARRRAWDALVAADGLGVREDGLWSLASGDGYEASRLLLPGFLRAFGGRVRGDPVAVVPHARLLLIGGSHDEGQITTMLHLAPRAWRSEAEPISPMLYAAARDGAVVPWVPDVDADPVLRATVTATRLALAAREYASQRDDLEEGAAYEVGLTAGDDLRQPYGFTRWPRGWTGTIPDCDTLVFCDGDVPLLAVALTDVVELLGMKPTTDLPRRWRASAWPDRGAWAKLRDRALPAESLG